MNYVVVPKGSVLMFDSVVLTPEAYEQLYHQAQAERIKALEEIAQIARVLFAAKDRHANYDWVDERASMEEYEQILTAELDADTQLRAAVQAVKDE